MVMKALLCCLKNPWKLFIVYALVTMVMSLIVILYDDQLFCSAPGLNKVTPAVVEYPGGFDLKRNIYRLVYSDPRTYKGPIVKGWPPGHNRHLPDYITGYYSSI